MVGLVLSGGGARGAYEAGVLRYLFQALPEATGRPFAPRVICGSSIGAFNGAWVAAAGAAGSAKLSFFWQTLDPERVYRFRARDLLSVPELFARRRPAGEGAALFDDTPFREHLVRSIPWTQLYERIDRDEIGAFVVAATDVASGHASIFVDGSGSEVTTPTTRMTPTRVGPDHVLASASIPFIFPPVVIDGRWYVDGSIRQNTPLSPAVDLGCDRILVIGSQYPDEPAVDSNPGPIAPTPSFLAGKALNALMLDPVGEDLRRLERINGMLAWAESAYPGFTERLGREHKPWRPIEVLHLRPSLDLGRVAAQAFARNAAALPWASRMLLRGVAGGEAAEDADLLSFLLFDRIYTALLEELGFRDAERRRDEIVAVLERDAG